MKFTTAFALLFLTTPFLELITATEISLIALSNEGNVKYLKTKTLNAEYLRLIPDVDTINELGLKNVNVTFLSDNEFKSFELREPIQSLKLQARNPDEIMRVSVEKALIMNPLKFDIVYRNNNNYKNPAFAEWQGRILLAWFTEAYHFPLTPELGGCVRLSWLEKGSFFQTSEEFYLGIGPNTTVAKLELQSNAHEEPRLLPLQNGSMLLTYTVTDNMNRLHYYKVMMVVDEATQLVQYFHSSLGMGEKNYIAFEYFPPIATTTTTTGTTTSGNTGQSSSGSSNSNNSEIMYIRKINPLHVLKMQKLADGTEVRKDVVVSKEEVKLPFDSYYLTRGELRGGSPLIRINNVLFSFFHTKSALPDSGNSRHTYFMGGITFCPNYPFNINRMSSYPILTPSLYDGPWLKRGFDYIVYPAGVALDASKEFVYASVGHQDGTMMVFKFNTSELLDSLTLVAPCKVDSV